jgi:hypothetical protein
MKPQSNFRIGIKFTFPSAGNEWGLSREEAGGIPLRMILWVFPGR